MIRCNIAIAFIENSDLLIVGPSRNLSSIKCLIKYDKYDVDCWLIDFDIDEYHITDVAAIFLVRTCVFIIMTDGIVFMRGDDYELDFDDWKQIYFHMPITQIYIYPNPGFIIDTDKKLWTWTGVEYKKNSRRYEFTNVQLVDQPDICVNDIDYCNNLILTEEGRILKYDNNQCNPHDQYRDLPIITSMDFFGMDIIFYDIDGCLHFSKENKPIEIIQLPDKVITCYAISWSKILFASDNILYYKVPNETIHEIAVLQTESLITIIIENKSGLIVACMDGCIYFLSVSGKKYIIKHIIKTSYNFSTRTIRAIKSANKY